MKLNTLRLIFSYTAGFIILWFTVFMFNMIIFMDGSELSLTSFLIQPLLITIPIYIISLYVKKLLKKCDSRKNVEKAIELEELKCYKCGKQVAMQNQLNPVGTTFSTNMVYYCKSCFQIREIQEALPTLIIYPILGAGMIYYQPDHFFGYALFNLFLFTCMQFLATALLLIGQTISLIMFGFPIVKLVIGSGKRLLDFELLNFPVEVNFMLSGGSVQFAANGFDFLFGKATIILSGILTNGLIATLIYNTFSLNFNINTFSHSIAAKEIAFMSLISAIGLSLGKSKD